MSMEFNIDYIEFDAIAVKNAAVDNETDIRSLDRGNYDHDITFSFVPGISRSQEKIRTIFSCEIKTYKTHNDGQREAIKISSKFEIEYYFNIKHFENFVSREKNEINTELLITISSLAYSTSRGIIYTKCQGTVLNHIIIPIIPNDRLANLMHGNKDQPI